MKDVAPHDRPREKLERLGPAGLGDNELLALVLGGGVRGSGALELANRVIEFTGGLYGLTRTAVSDLQRVRGVGRARAAQVIAAVEFGRRTLVREAEERPRFVTPSSIAAYLLPLYGASTVEQFGLVMLDSKARVIRTKLVSVGSIDSTIVEPREIFREAAAGAAASIILFHNHPSGDPTPSPNDLVLTARMIHAGEIMGIDVVDHIILADQTYYSLLESGNTLLPPPRNRSNRPDKIDTT
jgi:DNA repair protein RadC